MTNYSRANTTAQWFQDNYPGAVMRPNVVVLHTTEGATWPGYAGGSQAPNYTAMPDTQAKRLIWRAHFPDERSARALVNKAGGVETNTLNAVQVELVGTCVKGGPGLYWPEAPDWALQDLAEFLADQHRRHGLRLQGPTDWLAYGKDARRPGITPASYGASPARMTPAQWRKFYGICGHQHVPENVHGDPGAFPFARLLQLAKAEVDGTKAPTAPAVSNTDKATPTTEDQTMSNSWDHEFPEWGPQTNRPGTMRMDQALQQARGYSEDAYRTARRIEVDVAQLLQDLPKLVDASVRAVLSESRVAVDVNLTANQTDK